MPQVKESESKLALCFFKYTIQDIAIRNSWSKGIKGSKGFHINFVALTRRWKKQYYREKHRLQSRWQVHAYLTYYTYHCHALIAGDNLDA